MSPIQVEPLLSHAAGLAIDATQLVFEINAPIAAGQIARETGLAVVEVELNFAASAAHGFLGSAPA